MLVLGVDAKLPTVPPLGLLNAKAGVHVGRLQLQFTTVARGDGLVLEEPDDLNRDEGQTGAVRKLVFIC